MQDITLDAGAAQLSLTEIVIVLLLIPTSDWIKYEQKRGGRERLS